MPDAFQYRLGTRIRLALDALFWFGCQRIAAEVLRLRNTGIGIITSELDVFDTLTGTTRRVPVYHCCSV